MLLTWLNWRRYSTIENWLTNILIFTSKDYKNAQIRKIPSTYNFYKEKLKYTLT